MGPPVFQWHELLVKVHECVEDELCSGRPSSLITEGNIAKIRNKVMQYHQQTLPELGIAIPGSRLIFSLENPGILKAESRDLRDYNKI